LGNARSVEVSALLATVSAARWGRVSPCLYDTARLVSLAPWLDGHVARMRFLLHEQAADGGWGGPDGYALVPTLSATEALLTSLRRPPAGDGPDRGRVADAARRGVTVLRRWLRPAAPDPVPDTIAVELIVPALVNAVNAHLDELSSRAGSELDDLSGDTRLGLPRGMAPDLLGALRASVGRGRALPEKAWASLETLGGSATGAAFVRPVEGAVGCSPAATAAWLGQPAPAGHPSMRYLRRIQDHDCGAVPGVSPITYFEPAWVLKTLAGGGLADEVPVELLDRLDAALGEHGVPAAPGLPPDSDDTAGVLSALALHGRVRRPDSLLRYRADGYFACFPGERTASVSANAHILQALGLYLARRPEDGARFAPSVDMVAAWLLDNQQSDGHWDDKWHASPYYATSRCVIALDAFGGTKVLAAVARAVEWTLDTQRVDGSWGRWGGTVEETAYAVQILLRAGLAHHVARSAPALASAYAYLAADHDPAGHPGLWHAKDLYAPLSVIAAERLAAMTAIAGRGIATQPPRSRGQRPLGTAARVWSVASAEGHQDPAAGP